MPDLNRLGCIGIEHRHREIRPQSPASSRLRPIRAAKETTNRTAACVKVGVTWRKDRRGDLCRRHDDNLR